MDAARTKKLTKPQRMKMVTPALRQAVAVMSDEEVLALHDLLHRTMEERAGPHHAITFRAAANRTSRPRTPKTIA